MEETEFDSTTFVEIPFCLEFSIGDENVMDPLVGPSIFPRAVPEFSFVAVFTAYSTEEPLVVHPLLSRSEYKAEMLFCGTSPL